MVKRTANSKNSEPDQKKFNLPSEKEHLFQVVDFIESNDPDIILVKCEVCGGDEEGRTLLNRLSIDDKWKGFFATRLFLKAIDEPYKGNEFVIDTDNWIGKQFYATVIHNDKYANICEYNFDKIVEQVRFFKSLPEIKSEEIIWDEDAK